MRNLFIVAVLTMTVALLNTAGANAADKAATQQLPASLAALNVQPQQVLAASEATAVRGQSFYVCINGWVRTYAFSGTLTVYGWANLVNIYSDPYRFSFYGY